LEEREQLMQSSMDVKLSQSGAAAIIIAPYGFKKPWFLHLIEMPTESVDMPPNHDLFSPQRRYLQGGSGRPHGASRLSDFYSPLDDPKERHSTPR